MSRYKTLRTWSAFLKALGVISTILATAGVIAWAATAEGFWQMMAALLLGGPVAVLLAAWPIALGQALGALANIGDSLTFDPSEVPQISQFPQQG